MSEPTLVLVDHKMRAARIVRIRLPLEETVEDR
jgi:hypothetical protein